MRTASRSNEEKPLNYVANLEPSSQRMTFNYKWCTFWKTHYRGLDISHQKKYCCHLSNCSLCPFCLPTSIDRRSDVEVWCVTVKKNACAHTKTTQYAFCWKRWIHSAFESLRRLSDSQAARWKAITWWTDQLVIPHKENGGKTQFHQEMICILCPFLISPGCWGLASLSQLSFCSFARRGKMHLRAWWCFPVVRINWEEQTSGTGLPVRCSLSQFTKPCGAVSTPTHTFIYARSNTTDTHCRILLFQLLLLS